MRLTKEIWVIPAAALIAFSAYYLVGPARGYVAGSWIPVIHPFYPSPFADRGWNTGSECRPKLPDYDPEPHQWVGTCKYSGVGGAGYANVTWDGARPIKAEICYVKQWQGTPPCNVNPPPTKFFNGRAVD